MGLIDFFGCTPPRAKQRRRKGRGSRVGQSPAVKGWAVCRMHGARGGAPEGKRNGNYKTGEHTSEVLEMKRLIRALMQAKEIEALV
jgi:ribonuclease HI